MTRVAAEFTARAKAEQVEMIDVRTHEATGEQIGSRGRFQCTKQASVSEASVGRFNSWSRSESKPHRVDLLPVSRSLGMKMLFEVSL